MFKFRGKRIDTEELVYGYLYRYKGVYTICENIRYSEEYPVLFNTIEQYTGKNDKNGVELYAGDKIKYGDEIYLIKYGDSCFWLTQEEDDYDESYAIELHTISCNLAEKIKSEGEK